MTAVSVFCCLKGCLDRFHFPPHTPHVLRENSIQLDTAFMGNYLEIFRQNDKKEGAELVKFCERTAV